MERDFKGVWIPKEIYLNKNLSWSEKILLVEINSLDNDEEKGCFASNKYLGDFIGMKESSMANMISKLKNDGYLIQVFFDGRNRGLRVNDNMKADFIKMLKQTSQKNEHNNTSNNKGDKVALKDFDFSKEITSSSLSYKKNINRIGAVYRHLKDEDPNNITLVDHELLSDWMYAAEKLEAIDDKSFSRMFAFAKRHKFWGDKITGLPFLAKNWDKILIDYRKEG